MTRWLPVLVFALVCSSAFAQSYPARPIRLIVPVPAGGLQDTLARALAHDLGRAWGQTVVVDNRPGASSIIAGELAAKAAPDGYTFMNTDNVSLATNQYLRAKMPFDPLKDFTPVIGLVRAGNVLVVRPDSPLKDLKDLIAAARTKPGDLAYGSFGIGSAAHIDTEALAAVANIRMHHVPYRGGPDILKAVIAGDLAFSLTGFPPALPMIRQGRIRALAYGSLQRSPTIPDVPTFAETLPGFEAVAWFGWLAPAGTPKEIIERVHGELSRIIKEPEFKAKYIDGAGMEVLDANPAATATLLAADREKYRVRLQALGVKPE